MSSKAARYKRTARIHRGVRFAIQVAFFILAPGFFAAAFNGVKYVFQQLGLSAPIELTGFLTMLVAVLAFTVVFGRFFCGYACAFGTLGDVLYGVFEAVRVKTSLPRLVFPEKLVRALSGLKYVILLLICLLCFFGVWSAVSGYSPWVSFAGLVGGSIEGIAVGSFVALGLVAVLMILRERAFCQFLCPLGALFAILPVLGFSSFRRCKGDCIPRCGTCHKRCPVDIWPDGGLSEGECIACGRCADACPISNIHQGRTKLRGTEIGLVVVKAVLLLALFWLIGATRYLPSFADLLASMGVVL